MLTRLGMRLIKKKKMRRNSMLKELQELLGELYELYGATTQVVRLSEIVDYLVYEAQVLGIDTDGYYLN